MLWMATFVSVALVVLSAINNEHALLVWASNCYLAWINLLLTKKSLDFSNMVL